MSYKKQNELKFKLITANSGDYCCHCPRVAQNFVPKNLVTFRRFFGHHLPVLLAPALGSRKRILGDAGALTTSFAPQSALKKGAVRELRFLESECWGISLKGMI